MVVWFHLSKLNQRPHVKNILNQTWIRHRQQGTLKILLSLMSPSAQRGAGKISRLTKAAFLQETPTPLSTPQPTAASYRRRLRGPCPAGVRSCRKRSATGLAAAVPRPHGADGAGLTSRPVCFCAQLAVLMVRGPRQSPRCLLQCPFRHLLNDPTVPLTVTFDRLVLSSVRPTPHLFTPVQEHRQEEGLLTWAVLPFACAALGGGQGQQP